MTDISVVIPSLNEPYLNKTVEDIATHAEGDIEILVGDDAVEKLGQRVLTNKLVSKAQGKYIIKTDAHCSFSQGWDKALLEAVDDRTIVAPILMPLEPESWSINGKKRMTHYGFDTNFVMQHMETNENPETMCLQGSCWLVSRENYWKWNLGDETLPSWGSQAVELGIKAYLNGGRCMTVMDAYYGHYFRHSDAEFPYNRGENPGKEARDKIIARYKNQSIAGLIRKFNLPLDWTEDAIDALPLVV